MQAARCLYGKNAPGCEPFAAVKEGEAMPGFYGAAGWRASRSGVFMPWRMAQRSVAPAVAAASNEVFMVTTCVFVATSNGKYSHAHEEAVSPRVSKMLASQQLDQSGVEVGAG